MKMYFLKIMGSIGKRSFIFKNLILNYRDKILLQEIEKVVKTIETTNYEIKPSKKIVWIFWAQGLENAPQLVKICVNKMKQVFNDYDVIVLTMDNISRYVNIPEHIYEKLKNKKITYTHFSDILRLNLLCDYGGIWVDSTVYLNENFIPYIESVGNLISIPQDGVDYSISKGMWSAWLLGVKETKNYLYVMKTFLNLYWEKYNCLGDYFLIDYLLYFSYKRDMEFLNDVNDIARIPFSVYELANIRNDKCSEDDFNNYVDLHFVNKMNYRLDYKFEDKNTYSYYIKNK